MFKHIYEGKYFVRQIIIDSESGIIKMSIINYVAYLHGQLHLNSFRSFCIREEEKGNTMDGMVILYGSEDPPLINKDDLAFLPESNVIIRESDLNINQESDLAFVRIIKGVLDIFEEIFFRVLLLQYLKKKRNSVRYVLLPICKAISAKKILQLCRENKDDVKIVFIEEGLGYYIRTEKRWNERGLENMHGISKYLRVFRGKMVSLVGYKKTIAKLKRQGKIEEFCFFTKENEELVKNESICNLFTKAFESKRVQCEIDENIYYNKVLLNTQPFFEEIKTDEDLRCYKIIKEICDRNGLVLVIKPHPRELNLSRYYELGIDVETEYASYSQENILAAINRPPVCVLGFFSTTLVTANLFWNIPAVSLCDLICKEKTGGYIEDIDNFVRIFSNVVYAPKNYDDFEKTIKKIKARY